MVSSKTIVDLKGLSQNTIIISIIFLFMLTIYNFTVASFQLYDKKYEYDIKFNESCIVSIFSDSTELSDVMKTIADCVNTLKQEWYTKHEISNYGTKLDALWTMEPKLYTDNGSYRSSTVLPYFVFIVNVIGVVIGLIARLLENENKKSTHTHTPIPSTTEV
jgi:hypothetical protein